MSNDVGVLRDQQGLDRALALVDRLEAEYGKALPLVAARLVVVGALSRKESRGAHFRADYPALAAAPGRTLITWAQKEPAA
jgi:L-aspartate oxidase